MIMERKDISLAVYHMLQNSQPTSTSVEKSFALLKKLLAKDRNFKVENVRHVAVARLSLLEHWVSDCEVAGSMPVLGITWLCPWERQYRGLFHNGIYQRKKIKKTSGQGFASISKSGSGRQLSCADCLMSHESGG